MPRVGLDMASKKRTLLTADVHDVAAVLMRVSTPKQGKPDRYSLRVQRETCTRWCRERGYRIYDYYEDQDEGFIFQRPGLQRMLRDVKAGKIGVVVSVVFDRLARKNGLAFMVKGILDEYDVRIEFTDEQYDDTPFGDLKLAFSGTISEQERESIVRRTQSGRQARAKSGKLIASPVPQYGYRYGDPAKATYVIHESEAEIVRLVFRWYAWEGWTLRRICRELEARGVPTPSMRATAEGQWTMRGGPAPHWHATTIRNWLRCRDYVGCHVNYATYSWLEKQADEHTREIHWVRKHEIRPDDDEHRVTVPVPPILITDGGKIDLATWEKVQQRLRTNREDAPRRSFDPEAALLRSGFALCGHCGGRLYVERHVDRGVLYRHRDFTGKRVSCPSGGYNLVAKHADKEAWSLVAGLVRDAGKMRDLYRRLQAVERGQVDDADSTLKGVDRKLAETQQSIDSLMFQLETLGPVQNAVSATLLHRIEALTNLKAQLEEQRADVALRLQRADTQMSMLQAYEAWAAEVSPFLDEFPYQTKRDLLRGLDARVLLYKPGAAPVRMLVVLGWGQTLESYARGDAHWRVFLADTPEDLLAPNALSAKAINGEQVWDLRGAIQELLRPAVEAEAGDNAFRTTRHSSARDTGSAQSCRRSWPGG